MSRKLLMTAASALVLGALVGCQASGTTSGSGAVGGSGTMSGAGTVRPLESGSSGGHHHSMPDRSKTTSGSAASATVDTSTKGSATTDTRSR